MAENPYIEINPVAWHTLAKKVYQLTRETLTDPATYRITVKAIDQNDKGAGTIVNGYYFKDFLGHTYKIIAYTSTTIDVEDSFKIQFAPTSGKVGIVYKSVYNNDSPYLAPVFYKRLSKQAIEYSRQFELNILWNRNYFNGSCQITSLTDNGDGTVTIGEGKYCLNTETDGSGSTAEYTLQGDTFTLTDLAQNYIVADYNSGSPLVKLISDVTLINETTIVPVYTIFRNGVYLHTQNWDALGHSLANKVHQSIVKTQRYRRESGLAISESGTYNLSLTGGRVWTGAVPITLDAINSATDNLFLWYHSSGNWTVSVQSTYNYTQYDNGTNLATLTSNRYAVNWIFRGVESQKHLYIVLGTGDYTLAQAQAAKVPSLPIAISSHSVLVGKLVIQKNAATALTVESAFDTIFTQSNVNDHANLTTLAWSSSGHTGTANKIAGFGASGEAVYYNLLYQEVISFTSDATPSIENYDTLYASTFGQYPKLMLIIDDGSGNDIESTAMPIRYRTGGLITRIEWDLGTEYTGKIILYK